jgi:hypothetical protein
MMGLAVGHSTLHRLVNQVELPPAQCEQASEKISADGCRQSVFAHSYRHAMARLQAGEFTPRVSARKSQPFWPSV